MGGAAMAPGAAARGASAAKLDGPVDFEFLGLISDILRLVEPGEQGSAANAEVVKDKVEELQAKFALAKNQLERMDGADMTPQMQEDMFDLYALPFFIVHLQPGDCSPLPPSRCSFANPRPTASPADFERTS